MKTRNLILGTFFLLIIPGNAFAASFDCSKATSDVEKIICSDDELSRLDESLNKAYLQALKRTDIKEQTIKSQRQWLKNERNACRNAECLKKAYQTRIKELGLSSYGIVTFRPQTKTERQHEWTTAPSSKCFECLAHRDLPFEIYPGLEGSDLYIQPLEEEYGLSTNSILFIQRASEFHVAPLCNGNFVATWMFPHHNLPVPLTGRIFDSSFKTVHEDFPISDSTGGPEEWELSVSTLYGGGFVVTWKTWKSRAHKEIKLCGRIFDDAGKPKGKAFDICSNGDNNGGFVYGMPKGGFFVVWNNSNRNWVVGSALLKIYDGMGRPTTEEIIIDSTSGGDHCILKPRAYITSDGKINVFMTCQSSRFDRNYFFHSARSYTERGNPLTDVLTGSDMKSLEGYSFVQEQRIKERAVGCEFSLRKSKKESKERRDCSSKLLMYLYVACDMKTFTNDQRMKRFFTYYGTEYKKSCIVPEYSKDLKKCVQE